MPDTIVFNIKALLLLSVRIYLLYYIETYHNWLFFASRHAALPARFYGKLYNAYTGRIYQKLPECAILPMNNIITEDQNHLY